MLLELLVVAAADTDEEAQRLATSLYMAFLNIIKGTRTTLQPPVDNMDSVWSEAERYAAQQMLSYTFVGSAETVKAKMQAFQLQTERTKEYLELEVSKAFMELQLGYKSEKVLEKANTTAIANLKLIENYFKQGILQKTDLLSVQVRVNEIKNHLQYAKSNVQNASDYLGFLLNEDTAISMIAFADINVSLNQLFP